MTDAPPDSTAATSSPARGRWNICALVLLSIFAAWVFFHRLGAAEFTDWDEAWHAQVASEILTTGDWLTLHDRGQPYYNKPPLSFWLKATAFRVAGVNEAASRFFPALFGWGTVLLAAIFFGKLFGRLTGFLAALILCTSWLFTLYHTGRSGETDSALIFFLFATFACLWQARDHPRRYYAAAIFTALGWMTKGSTAYLAWPIALLAAVVTRASRPCAERRLKTNLVTPLLALLLAVLLTVPWQIAMLNIHGRAFASVFYGSEGAIPALHVVENHPGDPGFYFMVLHSFFEPWLLLAIPTIITAFVRRRSTPPQIFWIISWAVFFLVACSCFATKMVWYCAPVLPAMAALAAIGVAQLCQRRGGWIALLLAAGFSVVQIPHQYMLPVSIMTAFVLGVLALIWMLIAPATLDRRQMVAGALCTLAPVMMHFVIVRGVIEHGDQLNDWTAVSVDDEPWREISSAYSGRPIALVDLPMNPAAYYYLHRLKSPANVRAIKHDELTTLLQANPETIFITRIESSAEMKSAGLCLRSTANALTAWSHP